MELKPQTTLDEQVELLKEKGILINDSQKCTSLLKRINYYRFSAYYLPLPN